MDGVSKKKLILFDLDSTLIKEETIDEIAALAGVEEEVKEITREAMNGKLNFGQSLKKRVSLVKGLPIEKVKEYYEKKLKYLQKNTTESSKRESIVTLQTKRLF